MTIDLKSMFLPSKILVKDHIFVNLYYLEITDPHKVNIPFSVAAQIINISEILLI